MAINNDILQPANRFAVKHSLYLSSEACEETDKGFDNAVIVRMYHGTNPPRKILIGIVENLWLSGVKTAYTEIFATALVVNFGKEDTLDRVLKGGPWLNDEDTLDRVLKGGPWLNDDWLILVDYWKLDSLSRKVYLYKFNIWIRLYGGPLNFMKSKALFEMSQLVGEVMHVVENSMSNDPQPPLDIVTALFNAAFENLVGEDGSGHLVPAFSSGTFSACVCAILQLLSKQAVEAPPGFGPSHMLVGSADSEHVLKGCDSFLHNISATCTPGKWKGKQGVRASCMADAWRAEEDLLPWLITEAELGLRLERSLGPGRFSIQSVKLPKVRTARTFRDTKIKIKKNKATKVASGSRKRLKLSADFQVSNREKSPEIQSKVSEFHPPAGNNLADDSDVPGPSLAPVEMQADKAVHAVALHRQEG